MSLSLSIATYFIVWWVTLFAVLPVALRTQGEEGTVVPGTPESAPAKPRFLRIIALNTVVATIAFAIIWVIVTYRLLAGLDPVPPPTLR
jgi:predicted secreted protein